MRGSGSIIETVFGVGIALVMAILLFGKLDQLLPDQPRQIQCSIVKEQIVCKEARAQK